MPGNLLPGMSFFHTSDRSWSTDHLYPSLAVTKYCAGYVYVVHLQPRKHVLDRADFTAPTREHHDELPL